MAAEAGIEIEFIRKRNLRKEDRVKELLEKRGEHPGLVCIFSAMEPCSTYKPWHNKQTGRTYLVPDDGKCLHYYFISWTRIWGCVTFGCRRGCPAVSRSADHRRRPNAHLIQDKTDQCRFAPGQVITGWQAS